MIINYTPVFRIQLSGNCVVKTMGILRLSNYILLPLLAIRIGTKESSFNECCKYLTIFFLFGRNVADLSNFMADFDRIKMFLTNRLE